LDDFDDFFKQFQDERPVRAIQITIFIMGTSCEPLPKYAESIQVGAVSLIMDRWSNY